VINRFLMCDGQRKTSVKVRCREYAGLSFCDVLSLLVSASTTITGHFCRLYPRARAAQITEGPLMTESPEIPAPGLDAT
jgi:hypothetical protein